MYELIALASLSQSPASGYQIAKVINDAIGPYARISNGRLYPLLRELEAGGLIRLTSGSGGARRVRAYEITARGGDRLRELMMDTSSNPGDYQRIFHLKATVLGILEPAKRMQLLEHYRSYSQAHIRHLAARADELETLAAEESGPPHELAAAARLTRHRIRQWRLEVDLVDELRREDLVLGFAARGQLGQERGEA